MSMPWTAWQDQALAALVSQKLSARKIAAELKVSRNAVIGRARRLGLQLGGTPPGAPTVWTDERKAKLEKMVIDGYTDAEIGAEIGVSRHAVGDQRRRQQLAARANFRYRPVPTAARLKVAPASTLSRNPVSIIDIIPGVTCRWPVRPDGSEVPIEERATVFCGNAVVDSHFGSYCARHCQIAYSATPMRGTEPTAANSQRLSRTSHRSTMQSRTRAIR